MRAKDLIPILLSNPEAVVELDIDLHTDPGSGRPAQFKGRADRRLVEAVVHPRLPGVIRLVGCGCFRPDEEQKLEEGLYNRVYDRYEEAWNSLIDPAARRTVFSWAEVEEIGFKPQMHDDEEWCALPKVVQEMIMVRVDLPEKLSELFQAHHKLLHPSNAPEHL